MLLAQPTTRFSETRVTDSMSNWCMKTKRRYSLAFSYETATATSHSRAESVYGSNLKDVEK